MTIEIKVPMLPESVADAVVAKWYKQSGDSVTQDENLVDLETDKVMLEVPASSSGILKDIQASEGDTVTGGQVLCFLEKGGEASSVATDEKAKAPDQVKEEKLDTGKKTQEGETAKEDNLAIEAYSPAVRRLLAEHDLDAAQVKGTGRDGRLTAEDVKTFVDRGGSSVKTAASQGSSSEPSLGARTAERVPMSRLRAKVAERLLSVKNETAMLTTFNEVDMKAVMDIRAQYKEAFEKRHGVKLGFMSFFVKAVVTALKQYPSINASIDGSDIIYHGFFDVGIAVSAPRGLVVPVIRDVDQLSMAEIEQSILAYAGKARDNKLTLDEMTGGTFTVTNGGVFGSMLSTPILNPPQSAILGMHNIVKRAVVVKDEIVIRPMMYLALSYDHRIVDGRESVSFLVAIKQYLENPERLLLDI